MQLKDHKQSINQEDGRIINPNIQRVSFEENTRKFKDLDLF
jgi:hypothetical protein